jgi:peptidoglycan-associated lipoprotein
MMRGKVAMRVWAVLLSIGLLVGVWSCSSKRVGSTAGDESAANTGSTKAGVPVESVRQEPVVSVEPPPVVAEGAAAPDVRSALSMPKSGSIPSTAAAPSLGEPVAAGPDLGGPGDIYFDFDQYTIRGDARAVLEHNATWLRGAGGKTVLIEGHCDERGTVAYNLVLGEKRAKAAKHYLEDLGIPSSRMQTVSYGEMRPFCKEHNEGCWSKNRRAHFVVR